MSRVTTLLRFKTHKPPANIGLLRRYDSYPPRAPPPSAKKVEFLSQNHFPPLARSQRTRQRVIGSCLLASWPSRCLLSFLPVSDTSSDRHPSPAPKVSGVFATTHWSVVLAAGQSDSDQAADALEKLCRAYWYPLYGYIRRRGCGEQDAQDLTQGFFALLLQRKALRGVVPGKGKFRSFLLVALNHFLADEHERAQAQKRGGGQQIISFDAAEAEERYRLEPRHSETPEKLFERRWAITLLDGALRRLEQEFVAAGKAALFAGLRGVLLEDGETRPYAALGAEIGMSEGAIKKAAQRLRRRYQEIIREEIAQTVATPAEIEEELRHLCAALAT